MKKIKKLCSKTSKLLLAVIMVLFQLQFSSEAYAQDNTLNLSWYSSSGTIAGNSLDLTPSSNVEQNAVVQLNYSYNGATDAAIGEIEIRLPASLFTGRSGSVVDTMSTNLPLSPQTSTSYSFNYSIDTATNEIVITNYEAVASGTNFSVTFGYYFMPYQMEDGYTNTIEATVTQSSETVTSQQLDLVVNTQVTAGTLTKSKRTQYDTWQSAWGTEPVNSNDYYYVAWQIGYTGNLSDTQPYVVNFLDDIGTYGEVVGVTTNYNFSSVLDTDSNSSLYTHTFSKPDPESSSANYYSIYVVTKHLLSETTTTPTITNEVTVTVLGADEDTPIALTKSATHTYVSLDFTYSGDLFSMTKSRASTSSHAFRYVIPTAINALNKGISVGLDSDVYSFSMSTSSQGYSLTENGTKEYTTAAIDDMVFLGGEQLTDGDYSFTRLNFLFGSFAEYDYGQSKAVTDRTTYSPVNIYYKTSLSGEWQLYGYYSYIVGTGTRFTNATTGEISTINSGQEIILPDNTVAIKAEHSTTRMKVYFDFYVSVTLHGTSHVQSILDSNTEATVTNVNTMLVYDSEGNIKNDASTGVITGTLKNQVVAIDAERYGETVYHKSATVKLTGEETNSEISKTVTSTKTDSSNSQELITYQVNAYESAIYPYDSYTLEEISSTGIVDEQRSGTIYDLLPEGAIIDTTSISVKTYSSNKVCNYTTEVIENWQGSGQTMVIINAVVPEGVSNYSTTKTSTSVGTLYSGFTVTYTVGYSWVNANDYGLTLTNDVAYRSGVGTLAAGKTADSTSLTNKQYFKDLDNDGIADDTNKNTIYAENVNNLSILPVSQSGYSKKVKASDSTVYGSEAEVSELGTYTYQLRYQHSGTISASNIVFYDSLDNYTGSDWEGSLVSIDTSYAESKGIAPVIYYSTQSFTDNSILSTNLSDTSIWTTTPSDLSTVKSIAIDLSTTTTGGTYYLQDGETVLCYVTMKAPLSSDSSQSSYAYNQSHMSFWLSDAINRSSSTATKVSLKSMGIEISKTSNPTSGTETEPTVVVEDESVDYTISVKNKNKATTIDNIVVEDTIDSNLEYDITNIKVNFGGGEELLSDSTRVTLVQTGNTLTFTIDKLLGNETVKIIIPTKIASGTALTTVIENTSTITKIDGNDVDKDSNTTYHEVGEMIINPDKKVVDNNGDGKASPGEELTYTITGTNEGTNKLNSVLIQDTLDEILPYVDDTTSTTVTVNNDGTITSKAIQDLIDGFTVTLEAGKTVTVTFKVTVKEDLDVTEVDKLYNIATVGNENPEEEIPTGQGKLDSDKSVVDANGDGKASQSEELTYTISAENIGTATLDDVTIQDDLSELAGYVNYDATDSITINTNGIEDTSKTLQDLIDGFTLDLEAEDKVTVTFKVKVKADLDVDTVTNLKNIATVGETTPEKEIPTGKGNLVSDKSVVDANEDGKASPNEGLTYTISAENTGTVALTNVTIQDDLAELAGYVDYEVTDSITINTNGSEDTSKTILDLIDGFNINLGAGDKVTVTFKVTVKADLDVDTVTNLKNIATVGETTPEKEIPTGKGNLESDKSVVDANEDEKASPGEELTYTIRAENTGDATLSDVLIQDDLSELAGYVDYEVTDSITINTNGVEDTSKTLQDLIDGFTLDLEAEDKVTITFKVTVKSDLDVDTVTNLKNIATVGETTPEKEIPTGKGNLESDKNVVDTNGDGKASPSEELTYTISAENTGDATLADVLIQDDLSELAGFVDYNTTDSITINTNGSEDTSKTIQDLIDGFTLDLEAEDKVTVTFKVTVKADLDVDTVTNLMNIATVGETTPEKEIPTGKGNLESDKSVVDTNGDGKASPSEELTYTISAENTGDATLADVLIQDDLSELAGYVDYNTTDSITINTNGSEDTSKTIQDLIDGFEIDLEAEDKVTITFKVTVKADLDVETVTNLKNIATVGETTPEKEISTGKGNLDSDKSVVDANGDGKASPSEELTYTISAENTGTATLNDVTIQDDLAILTAHVDYDVTDSITINTNGIEDASKTIQDLIDGFTVNLEAGDSVTVTFKVTVKADLDVDTVTSISNIATVGDTIPDIDIPTSNLLSNKDVVDANGDGKASPSEELTYTITGTNKGTATATNVTIQDTLADVLPYVEDTSGTEVTVNVNGTETTKTIQDLIDGFEIDLGAGETVTVTFKVTVKADLDVETVTSLKNIATIGDSTPEKEIPTGKGILESDKNVVDASGDGKASPSEELTYTISAENTGNATLSDVVIQDDLASLLPYVEDTTATTVSLNQNGTVSTKTIQDLIEGFTVNLEAGDSVTVTFKVTVKADLDVDTVTSISNIATVGDTIPDIDIPTSNLLSNKDVVDASGDGKASPGEELTYTITGTNKGTATATNVTIQDTLADVLPYVEDTSGTEVTVNVNGTETTKTIQDLIDGFEIDLGAGETVTVTFKVTVKTDLDVETITSLKNIATVGDSTPEEEIPTGKGNLESDKNVVDASGDGKASPSEELTYTISAENTGDATLSDVVIQDDLASLLPYVEDTTATTVSLNQNGTVSTKTIQDLIDGFTVNLEAGDSVTVTFKVTVKADLDVDTVTSISNIATVGSTTPDIDIPTSNLLSNKDVVDANGDGKASPGEELTYTITGTNKGTATATNVTIQDTLAEVLPYVEDTSGTEVTVNVNGTETTKTIQDLIDGFEIDLGAGETVTVTFKVTVKTDLDVETITSLKNIATVGDTTPEKEIPTTPKPVGNLVSDKNVVDASGDGIASPSEELTYTISAENNGTATLNDITIQDDLATLTGYVDYATTDSITINTNGSEDTSKTIQDLIDGFNINLSAGDKVTITFKVTVKADLDVETVTSLKNIATIGDSNPEEEIPTGKGNLESDKSVVDANGDGKASPNEELTYTISAENTGTATLPDVIIQDDLSTLTGYVDYEVTDSITINTNGSEDASKTIQDLIDGFEVDLVSGDKVTVTFKVTVKADLDVETVTSISNIATVGDSTPEKEIPTGKGTLESDKSVVDANGDGKASPNEELTYTISAENTGTATLNDVIIQDVLTELAGYVNYATTDSITININGTVTTKTIQDLINGFTLDLEAGDKVTVIFKVTVKADLDVETVTSLKNIATIGDSTPEEEIPTGKGNLEGDKSVVDTSGDGKASPSEELTYTISAENTGTATLNNVTIQDDLSTLTGHVDYEVTDSITISTNGTEDTSKTIQDLIDGFNIDLGAGDKVTVRFKVTVKADLDVDTVTSINNIATVGETTPDIDIPTSNLLSNKNVVDDNGDGIASQGEELTYTITGTNKGTATATNVTIQDTLTNVLPYVEDTSGTEVTVNVDGTESTKTIQDLIDGFTVDLGAGETVTVSFKVTVKADLDVDTVTSISNIATVGDTTPGTDIPTTNLEEDKYTVDYEFKSSDGTELPEEVINLLPTDDNEYSDGDVVTPLIPGETTVVTEEGTWTFVGYDKDEVTIDGSDETFIGTWTFTPNSEDDEDKYTVDYEFKSSDGTELPEEVINLLPTDDNEYSDGDVVTALIPGETVVITEEGTWTFVGYDKDEVTIDGSDETFIGTWTFTPNSEDDEDKYTVDYEFKSSDGSELPEEIINLLPTDDNEYSDGDVVTALIPGETVVITEEGTWTFVGYDKDEVTIDGSDETFIGTWTFTPNSEDDEDKYTVDYEFKSSDGTELPEEVINLLPTDDNEYSDGDVVIPLIPGETVVITEEGTWTFVGYDKDEVTIDGSDETFIGTWTFTPNSEDDEDKYTVDYEFKSSDGTELPEEVINLLPTDDNEYSDGDVVIPLIPGETVVITEEGTWTFVGYDKDEVTIDGSDETFIGTWTFTPNSEDDEDKYTVDYEFKSSDGTELPEEVTNLLPTDSNEYKDRDVVIPLVPGETVVVTEEGTWTFVGYDKDEVTIDGSNETFTGTWVFTPNSEDDEDKYTVDYEFKSSDGSELPEEIINLLPTDDTKYSDGDVVTALIPGETTVVTEEGTWTFIGYDKDEVTIDGSNETFTGTWVFTPNSPNTDDEDDTPTTGDNNSTTTDDGTTSNGVKTGDDTNIITMISAILLSMLGIVYTVKKKYLKKM